MEDFTVQYNLSAVRNTALGLLAGALFTAVFLYFISSWLTSDGAWQALLILIFLVLFSALMLAGAVMSAITLYRGESRYVVFTSQEIFYPYLRFKRNFAIQWINVKSVRYDEVTRQISIFYLDPHSSNEKHVNITVNKLFVPVFSIDVFTKIQEHVLLAHPEYLTSSNDRLHIVAQDLEKSVSSNLNYRKIYLTILQAGAAVLALLYLYQIFTR